MALAMSGLPALALAESGSTEGQNGVTMGTSSQMKVQVTAREQGEDAPMGVAAHDDRSDDTSSSTMRGAGAPPTISASPLEIAQLRLSIDQRRQELDQEEASSSPQVRDVMKDTNPIRLAVHTLLASKGLLGGIGQQVSDIAQQLDDSATTTASAETQIESRGFFTKLLFGGDTAAAKTIADQVAKSQQRIVDLTALLNKSGISADVMLELKDQITTIQETQTRLQALAQKEQNAWGLFSWRF